MFHAANVTQVFTSGNDIKISVDLMRRSLVAELFLSTEVRGRKYEREITVTYLRRPEVRQGFLSAMCALVRHYIQWRADLTAAGAEIPEVPVMASFEDWSRTISSILQASGYDDPLRPPDLGSGGAEEEDEMKELLVKVATAAEADTTFERKALVTAARELGLLESLVGLNDEKELDSKAMIRFGKQLQRHRGREYKDERGRRFRFSHRRQKKGATYPLVFIAS